MLAWTEQVKCRGLSEQPINIRMVTKSCNIKLINEITWINVNHSSSTALERSVSKFKNEALGKVRSNKDRVTE